MNKKNYNFKGIIWGLILIAVAVILILQELGYNLNLGSISWFEWIILIGCASGLYNAFSNKEIWSGAFSLGIIYCVLDDVFGWPTISVWVMFFAIVVGGIGIHMLFDRKATFIFHSGEKDVTFEYRNREEFREKARECLSEEDGTFFQDNLRSDVNDFLEGDVVFSSVSKYINSNCFRGGHSDVVFSTEKLYFDSCNLCNNQATLKMDIVFSHLELFVPQDWNIVDNMGRFLSSRSYSDHISSSDAPTLTLNGDCVFSSIKIVRI